jgi:hypothetical protein
MDELQAHEMSIVTLFEDRSLRKIYKHESTPSQILG